MRSAAATPPRLSFTSSPQRVEKLAMPPFKLLKGKGGSRSRRRSPLFPTRTRTGSSIQEGREPSSPKVTCIGQVRIKKKKTITKAAESTHRPPTPSSRKPKSNPPSDIPPPISSSPRGLRRRCSILTWWLSSLCPARYEEKKAQDDDASPTKEKARVLFDGLVEKDVAEEVKAPSDALLLMRCKSAPYKDSDFTFETKRTEEKDDGVSKASLDVRDRESSDDDASREGDERLLRSLSSRPLMLARCRSEPWTGKARGSGDGCKSFDRCEKARTSLTLAAEALPFGLLQSTFRFV